MSNETSVIEKYLTNDICDGQYKVCVADAKVIKRYLKSIEEGNSIPEVLNVKGKDIYFSWKELEWDSEKLKQNVKRVDYISDSVCTKEDVECVFKFIEPTTDLCYIRVNERHPIVGVLDYFKNCTFCSVKYMLVLKNALDSCKEFKFELKLLSEINSEVYRIAICELAKKSFTINRFTRDAQIEDFFVKSIYEGWLNTYFNNPERLLCCLYEDKIKGFLAFDLVEEEDFLSYGFVDLIAVDEAIRRQSIASTLIDALINKLQEKKVNTIFANIDSENESSYKFFVSRGFKRFNTINEYHWRK